MPLSVNTVGLSWMLQMTAERPRDVDEGHKDMTRRNEEAVWQQTD